MGFRFMGFAWLILSIPISLKSQNSVRLRGALMTMDYGCSWQNRMKSVTGKVRLTL